MRESIRVVALESALSSRLVTRNGVLLMGVAALAGLTRYWWSQWRDAEHGLRRLALSAFALLITVGILVVIIVERFLQAASLPSSSRARSSRRGS